MTQIRREGVLFCFVGPTGSGKSTIAKHLLRKWPDSLSLSVSATTREPRAKEVDGIHYHFLARSDFEARRDNNEFFEWEEVHGNLYGTLRKTLDEAVSAGSDLLLDIDIRGALSVEKAYPYNTAALFLLPPSFEVLKERLMRRGGMDEDTLSRRFETAKEEYSKLLSLEKASSGMDYVIVNDDLEHTIATADAIITAERSKRIRLDPEELKNRCVIPEGE